MGVTTIKGGKEKMNRTEREADMLGGTGAVQAGKPPHPTFADAKIGDPVFSVRFGWEMIVNTGNNWLVMSGSEEVYDLNGIAEGDTLPTLFHAEVKIVPPPRPVVPEPVEVVRWVCLSCGMSDKYDGAKTGWYCCENPEPVRLAGTYTPKAPGGQKVEGAVTGGFLKGNTIRLK